MRENEGHNNKDNDINNLGKKREEIEELDIYYHKLEGYLDLNSFVNLRYLNCSDNQLTNLDLSKCSNLEELSCYDNQFTSVDFLNTLPRPEKLEDLVIFNNNIQPTDIAYFSKFVNLRNLEIGTGLPYLELGKRNKFYGSFES